MIGYRYNPFSKTLAEFPPEELNHLRDVSEGWFIDYKSQPITPKDFGKTLSAFANQFGGWLFVGVEEGPNKSLKAELFPGVPTSDVGSVMVKIREGVSAHVSPAFYFDHRIIDGPVDAIGLKTGRSVIVIGVPEGANPPYIHSTGKIYRRIADSSEPKAETDRAVLDTMWRQSQHVRAQLRDFVMKPSENSRFDNTICHVFLMEDLTLSWPEYTLDLKGFREAMTIERSDYPGFRLDNIYSTQDGFVARHLVTNDAMSDLYALRWWRNGNVRLTIPINDIRLGPSDDELLNSFADALGTFGYRRILNLDEWMFSLFALLRRYLDLRTRLRFTSPIYGKIVFSNTLSAMPFIGMESYLKTLKHFGIPVVQDTVTMFPVGVGPNNFLLLEDSLEQDQVKRHFDLLCPLLFNGLKSLGVTFECDNVTDFIPSFTKEIGIAMDRAVAAGKRLREKK